MRDSVVAHAKLHRITCEPDSRRPATSSPRLLVIEGCPWDSTSGWTESERCSISADTNTNSEPPQHRRETLSMNCSEDSPTVAKNSWNLSLRDHSNVDHATPTRMSAALSTDCNGGPSTDIRTVWTIGTGRCTTTGASMTLPKNCTCGISTYFCGTAGIANSLSMN